MLAFSVSFWGLHYKLSLYRSIAAHPAAPAAKLLSQKERPLASRHLEGLLLSGPPYAKAPRTNVWSDAATVAANAPGTDLRRAEDRDGWAETTGAARRRVASLAGPRAPPITA